MSLPGAVANVTARLLRAADAARSANPGAILGALAAAYVRIVLCGALLIVIIAPAGDFWPW